MKAPFILAALFSVSSAFVTQRNGDRFPAATITTVTVFSTSTNNDVALLRRRDVLLSSTNVAVSCVAVASLVTMGVAAAPEVAHARGRATFEQTYRKFYPRIRDGGVFYNTELKQLVAAADFAGVRNALREPPPRQQEDLTKPDSGVAARARQAGKFSDARVLVAADLLASAFSESSISPKTKKMQAAVMKMRAVVEEMESVSQQALGESGGGGLFGFGAKPVDKSALAKQLKALYIQGGNAYNEYVLAANDNLALQFDKLSFIK